MISNFPKEIKINKIYVSFESNSRHNETVSDDFISRYFNWIIFQFEAIFPMNINSIFLCIKFSALNCQSHHFWTINKTQQLTVRQSCAILRASNPFEGRAVHVEKRLQRVAFKQFHLLTIL